MTQSKLRLNTDIRKKIGGLILSHFENEKTTELENFISAKEDITTAYNTAFKIASNVVGRAYPKDDVATLQNLKRNMVVRVMLWLRTVVFILQIQKLKLLKTKEKTTNILILN
jgi:hypothetical protein